MCKSYIYLTTSLLFSFPCFQTILKPSEKKKPQKRFRFRRFLSSSVILSLSSNEQQYPCFSLSISISLSPLPLICVCVAVAFIFPLTKKGKQKEGSKIFQKTQTPPSHHFFLFLLFSLSRTSISRPLSISEMNQISLSRCQNPLSHQSIQNLYAATLAKRGDEP